jgi:Rieske Fe-S protein
MVYLRRNDTGEVEALNVICPHAGCHVGFRSAENSFHCPCHESWFALDGSVQGKTSASPRALDTLPVELRDNGEVWVRFQNFRTGTAQKVPLA